MARSRGASKNSPRLQVLIQQFMACSCSIIGLAFSASLALAQPLEQEVKAAFLYNFAKFVEWPAPTTGLDAFTLCVLGADRFAATVEEITQGKKVHGTPFTVRRIGSVKEVTGCQIVFISATERKRLTQIVNEIGGLGVLTVSETPGFTERGGMINFFLENDRVRFEINPKTAAHEKLRISAQLLKLARVVE